MPKIPETQNRFRIFADVPETTMGSVLAALTRMGLEHVGYELITDVVTFKTRPTPVKHEQSAEDALTEWAKEHPTFLIIDAIKHFTPLGRSKAVIYQAANGLTKKGVLNKLGPKNYALASVKAIAAPSKKIKANGKDKAAAPLKRTRKSGAGLARYDVPNKDLIAKAIGARKRFVMDDLKQFFLKEKRNPKSISPVLTKFIQSKNIKITGPGQYEVIKKIKLGNQQVRDREPEEQHAPVLNGPAPVAVESSNG